MVKFRFIVFRFSVVIIALLLYDGKNKGVPRIL